VPAECPPQSGKILLAACQSKAPVVRDIVPRDARMLGEQTCGALGALGAGGAVQAIEASHAVFLVPIPAVHVDCNIRCRRQLSTAMRAHQRPWNATCCCCYWVSTAPAPGSTRRTRTTAAPRPPAQLQHQGARPQASRRGGRTRAAKHKRRKGQPPLRRLPHEQNRRLSGHTSLVYASPGQVACRGGRSTHRKPGKRVSALGFCPVRAPRERRQAADRAGACQGPWRADATLHRAAGAAGTSSIRPRSIRRMRFSFRSLVSLSCAPAAA